MTQDTGRVPDMVRRSMVSSPHNILTLSPTTLPQLYPPVPTPPSVRLARAKVSKRKAALIGVAIGASGGAAVGAVYCRADCGGGPTRGVLVFSPIGAGIGAALRAGPRVAPVTVNHGVSPHLSRASSELRTLTSASGQRTYD